MNTEEIKQLHERYVMPTYAPSLALVKGKGAKVWDAEGNEYLDLAAGIAVNNLGHAHPRLVKAIRKQAATLMHVSNLYYNELQPQLARALVERSLPSGKCFFCNSGAEANEALIKLARLWGSSRGKYEVISMSNSFHGRTLATLTATGQEKVKIGFDPLPEGFVHAEFNDLDACRAAVTGQTAAILVEAIQGEGGVCPADEGFFAGLRALCDEKGLLLLIDEVQCGMGRTGRWFGYQHSTIQPDAFSVAKGLGGGFPIGAIVAGPKLADVFQPGNHATTFGGNPLACAAALAVIEEIEEADLLTHVELMGESLRKKLGRLVGRHSWIEAVRGQGLLVGLVLTVPAAPLQQQLLEQGVIAIATAGNVLRLVPPLNIKKSQINHAVRALREACQVLDERMTVEAQKGKTS